MSKKQFHSGSRPDSNSKEATTRRVPLWQKMVLPVLALLIFSPLLEGGLALFGIKPVL
ncbi:hypothetical protein WDW89_24540 [Deltaproteobacteria bacterium TL4]